MSSTVFGLRGRSFLKELDFTPDEWDSLLELSLELKNTRQGKEGNRLKGKHVALLFEKPSTRTRCAFEVAVQDQGGFCTYLDSSSSMLGHKESIADTAQVLSRFYDGIEYRGFAQADVETLAEYASVPVYNGLSDDWHPTQMLADQLTMHEYGQGRDLSQLKLAYLGDARNNVGNSTLIASAMMGVDVRIVGPESLQPAPEIVAAAQSIADDTGAKITITDQVDEGVKDVDFIYTDVWVSLGEPVEEWGPRIELLHNYQVTKEVMAKSGNDNVKFMHCLPSFHDLETRVAKQVHAEFGLDCLEVSNEVFTSDASIVFDQAENRMHTIKAVLVATLA